MSLSVEELVAEFEKNHDIYNRFTAFCHQEIEQYIKNGGVWYQIVQSRTKSKDSLLQKAQSNTLRVKSLSDIRDLSGVRVITYIDSELSKIQDALWWNRQIGKLKVQKWERRYRDPGFIGNFITLTPDESLLSELPREFAGLRCELQLTTILQHGWAEVYHRSIRAKREDLSDFSPKQLSAIEKEYEKLVKGPLREVADNIHFLYKEAVELGRGVEYRVDDPVLHIAKASNTNDLLDGLKAVADAVDKFGRLLPSLTHSLPILVSYHPLIDSLPTVPRLVSGHEFNAASRKECLRELLKVTCSLGFTDIKCFLGFLFDVWKQTPDARGECESQLREFLRWDVKILRAWGYAAHREIVEQLESLFSQSKLEDWKLFVLSAEHLLGFRLEGAWETGLMTFSIPTGCVRIDEDLSEIRSRAFGWLLKIATSSDDSGLRLHALRALFNALHIPSSPAGSVPGANELILKECKSIISSLSSLISTRSVADLIVVFDGCRDLEYWYQQEGISASEPESLRALIENEPQFVRFQQLVGKSKFSGDFAEYSKWKEDRKQSAKDLAKLVTDSTWLEWKELIIEASHLHTDLGTEQFEPFQEFLKSLCELSPLFASQLLEDEIQTLGRFSSQIIFELLERGDQTRLPAIIVEHLKSGRAVVDIAYGVSWSKKVDLEFVLESIGSIELEKYPDAVGILVENLLKRTELQPNARLIVLASIEALARHNNFSWYRFFFQGHYNALTSFSFEEWERILTALLMYPKLDYHFEELLIAASNCDTLLVLDFLLKRIKVGRERDRSDGVFDSHPRHMSRLASVLEQDSERLGAKLIAEFINSDYIGRQFYAGALLSEFISLNSAVMANWLNSLADSKQTSDHELMLEALHPHGNTVLAHPYYKRLIQNKRCDKKLWKEIASKLLFVESYRGDDGGLLQKQAFASSIASWSETDGLIEEFKRMFADIAKISVESEEERLSRERAMRSLDYEMRTGQKPKKVSNE